MDPRNPSPGGPRQRVANPEAVPTATARPMRPELMGVQRLRAPLTPVRGAAPGQAPVQMTSPATRARLPAPVTSDGARQRQPSASGPRPAVRPPQSSSSTQDVSEQMSGLDIEGRATMPSSSGSGSSGDTRAQALAQTRMHVEQYVKTRPADLVSKKGDGGTTVQLRANYFHVKKIPQWTLFQYRVDFSIEEDRTSVRRKMMYDLKPQIGPYVFEGTMLFTTRRLVKPDEKKITFNVLFEDKPVTIDISGVGEVRDDAQLNHFLNNLIKKCTRSMGLIQIKRDVFDKQNANVLVEEKIEIWPGYRTSLRRHEEVPLLCCDLVNKIIRMDNSRVEIHKLMSEFRNNKNEVAKALIGRTVMTTYNNKMYRVDDVLWNECPGAVFKDGKGRELTIAAYVLERYNMKVGDLKQPLLMSNPTSRMKRAGIDQPVKLIPELCKFTGLTENEKANFRFMANVGNFTRSDPPKRVQMLRAFGKNLLEKKEVVEVMKEWDLAFDPDLVTVPGRLMAPERITVGGSRIIQYQSSNADWSQAFNQPISAPVEISKLAVIFPSSEKSVTDNFVADLKSTGAKMGILIGHMKPLSIPDTRTSSYVKALKEEVLPLKPSMTLILVPSNKGDAYSQIKKITYVENAMPCQVMTLAVLKRAKNVAPIAKKVIAQMSAKLGAELWKVTIPLKGLMVVGFDTWHDSSERKISIGALVCSLNNDITQYASYAIRHQSSEELSSQIVVHLASALRRYEDRNGRKPDRLFFYRDGVGEGQIAQLRNLELESIKNLLSKHYPGLKLTFIIVSKRINTRFYLNSAPNTFTNPMSGTVVDDVVTLPERYDFFLVSQSVTRGTVNPSSYNVILDQSGLPPKHLQALSYKLTHLYFNWPGTIRVPSVCQYAHKLAYLVGESLHSIPHKDLSERLFYL